VEDQLGDKREDSHEAVAAVVVEAVIA